MNTPAPHEWETKLDYLVRFAKHPMVIRTYPTAPARRAAGERRWAECKLDSLVSITTEMGEVLLFD